MSTHRKGGGWIAFAGILMILVGINQFINGLWALNADKTITSQFENQLLFSDTNLDTWGYIYVVVGALVAIAGLCVFWRMQWARWVGIIVATISAISAFFWLFSPYWAPALAILVIDLLVLHGLINYGDKEETYA